MRLKFLFLEQAKLSVVKSVLTTFTGMVESMSPVELYMLFVMTQERL